jgi:hypothetical protein
MKDKIWYAEFSISIAGSLQLKSNSDVTYHRLVVRMLTAVHELFIARVVDAIHTQLMLIRDDSSMAAKFAMNIYPARSTEICFPTDDSASSRK